MKFIVTYIFAGDEDEDVQIDIVEYKDKKGCIKAYNNTKEYVNVQIEEYDENMILEDINFEDDDLYEHDNEEYIQGDDDYDTDEEGVSILLPNSDTKEELEEELEHVFSKMIDN